MLLDEKRHIRLISHLLHPFEHATDNPYVAAVAYLRTVARQLGLSNAALAHLEDTIPDKRNFGRERPGAVRAAGTGSISDEIQLRWSRVFSIRREATVLMIQQTRTVRKGRKLDTLDVQFAGLRIVVHHPAGQPSRITSIASALTHLPGNLDVNGPSRGEGSSIILDRRDLKQALDNFGLPMPSLPRRAKIKALRFLYRLKPEQQPRRGVRGRQPPKLYCIANAIRVVPGDLPHKKLPGRAPSKKTKFPAFELIFREGSFRRLEAKPLGTHAHPPGGNAATARVFEIDPISATGDFAMRPGAAPKVLDRNRKPVGLAHLDRPRGNGSWRLSGRNVRLYDGDDTIPKGWGWIRIPPPTEQRPHFDFHSRTNDFAAVNAYYHLDQMFTLLETLEMPFSSFPMGYTLPVPIIHRAAVHPGSCSDGNCVNAQVRLLPRNGDFESQTVFFAFALADLSRNPGTPKHPIEPLGIACDVRVVWHEFCHALIAAATDFLEFRFAHSAGDALAAINGDPMSRLAAGDPENEYRGVTFPWGETPNRRHDRSAGDGWSWSSARGRREGYEDDTRDMFGYAREQILSSTLFRLYRAIGGDATRSAGEPHVAERKAAASYVTYLIVRAILSLGPQRTVPAWNAEAFAIALAEADIGTSTANRPPGRIGGTVHKVIRWAFEKQGAFKTDDAPPLEDGSSRPEPVDVFLQDGRDGEYQYKANWQAAAEAIWNNVSGHPRDPDIAPVAGRNNYIFVRVKNRGYAPARNVAVHVFSALKDDDGIWPAPSKWTPLRPSDAAPQPQHQRRVQDDLVLGPFPWRPLTGKSYSILVRVEADGDYSNINPATMLPCALHPTPLARFVPHDNNIGLRTISVP